MKKSFLPHHRSIYKTCTLVLSLTLAVYAAPSGAQSSNCFEHKGKMYCDSECVEYNGRPYCGIAVLKLEREKNKRKACEVDKLMHYCASYARELLNAERFTEAEKYFKLACDKARVEAGEDNATGRLVGKGYEDAEACRYMAAYYYYNTETPDQKEYCGYNAYGEKVAGSCNYRIDGFIVRSHTLAGDRKPDKKTALQYLKTALEKAQRNCADERGNNIQGPKCVEYKELQRVLEIDDHSKWWTTAVQREKGQQQLDAGWQSMQQMFNGVRADMERQRRRR